jgi:Ca-activated chloride channel family protein
MNPQEFGLRNIAGGAAAAPVLQHVTAQCRLDGLLLDSTVRQAWRNTSKDVLEVVYTFPLAPGAVLLGFSVTLAGRRQVGAIVEKIQAQQRYEEAMESGDAPILLERSGDGLCTVNLGNFKPGEEAVIEYRSGELVAVEQGRVRICVPTTVAPRYGDPLGGGKLQPHQVPEASLSAEYGLTFTLDVDREWAKAPMHCATHRATFATTGSGARLSLGDRAWLDRDVVVTLDAPSSGSRMLHAADGAQQVVLASFQPARTMPQRDRIDLKLLVDCSGSMAGDSMQSARVALAQVVRQLREDDRFSYSRFGDRVHHGFRRMATVKPHHLAMLQAMIAVTQADLGGTQMLPALESTIALRGTAEQADILLITDGEVWDAGPMIAAAAASKHRIFAVGVGNAPAHSLLRRLAEASGGACEFATPGESLEAAVDRMFARIRQQSMREVRVQWSGGEPEWVTPLPGSVFAGDMIHVFAGFAQALPRAATLVSGDRALAEASLPASADAGDALPRMAAASRIDHASADEALALALRYQLLTDRTNFLVIHERAEADKATEMAQLHQVASMLAAGWGGVGMERVRGITMAAGAAAMPAPAGAVRMAKLAAAPMLKRARLDALDAAPMETGRAARASSDKADADEVLRSAIAFLSQGREGIADAMEALKPDDAVMRAISALQALGLDSDTAWMLLVRWLAEQRAVDLDDAAEEAMERALDGVSAEQWQGAIVALADSLDPARA